MLQETVPEREETFQRIYRQHVDTVYRLSFSFMKNNADAEDVVQETFLKLLELLPEKRFDGTSHEKAWLIVTASNICKNHLKSWTRQKRKEMESFDELPDHTAPAEDTTLSAVLQLPDKYKTVIYLYYYEEYSCSDIAAALKKNESTVRSLLKRGRAALKKKLGGELPDDECAETPGAYTNQKCI